MKITKKYSNRKTLALQVLDGQVIVRAPFNTPDSYVDSFIESKKSWLEKRLSLYQPLGYEGQDTLRVFGNLYSVQIENASRFGVMLLEEKIILKYPNDTSISRVSEKVDAKFKADLHEIIQEYLEKYCQLLGINVPNFMIRKYKRLYGRCSRSGNLAFNTYLYHESLEFIEYVVVHELAHLYEFNHSTRFYAVVSKMMPHYKEILKRKKSPHV